MLPVRAGAVASQTLLGYLSHSEVRQVKTLRWPARAEAGVSAGSAALERKLMGSTLKLSSFLRQVHSVEASLPGSSQAPPQESCPKCELTLWGGSRGPEPSPQLQASSYAEFTQVSPFGG